MDIKLSNRTNKDRRVVCDNSSSFSNLINKNQHHVYHIYPCENLQLSTEIKSFLKDSSFFYRYDSFREVDFISKNFYLKENTLKNKKNQDFPFTIPNTDRQISLERFEKIYNDDVMFLQKVQGIIYKDEILEFKENKSSNIQASIV